MTKGLLIEQMTAEELKAGIQSWITDALAKSKPAEKPEEEELLTEKEAVTILKVSRQTLKNWRDTGLINYKRRGKSVRYYKSDVLAKNPKGL